jgi:large subunit ribosomal protein L25
MAKTVSLKGSVRSQIGTKAAKAARGQGLIPGIMYGKKGSRAVQFAIKEINPVLHLSTEGNLLIDLELDDQGKKDQHLALIQEIQVDPVKDYVIHVDLHEVAKDEKLHAEVRVVEFGEPIGLKQGGLLELFMRHLRIECLPKDLPEIIRIDVSHLEVGQSVHVGEVVLPEGVTVLNPKDLPVVSVIAPAAEEEPAAPAAGAAVKQPEAIKEKKADAAAAAPAAKDAKAKK